MEYPKHLVFSFLLLIAAIGNLRAQNAAPDCDDIKVEVITVQPSGNLSNGSIELVFTKSVNNYKIFLLNAGSDKTGKEEIKSGKIANLKPGFFDFLILDRNKKNCVKQLTVVLK